MKRLDVLMMAQSDACREAKHLWDESVLAEEIEIYKTYLKMAFDTIDKAFVLGLAIDLLVNNCEMDAEI